MGSVRKHIASNACAPPPPPHLTWSVRDTRAGVDGTDEWEWISPDDVDFSGPPALPVPGCWREGLEAGDVDKIFLVREASAEGGGEGGGAIVSAGDSGSTSSEGRLEFYVKWKAMAHLHCQMLQHSSYLGFVFVDQSAGYHE